MFKYKSDFLFQIVETMHDLLVTLIWYARYMHHMHETEVYYSQNKDGVTTRSVTFVRDFSRLEESHIGTLLCILHNVCYSRGHQISRAIVNEIINATPYSLPTSESDADAMAYVLLNSMDKDYVNFAMQLFEALAQTGGN